MKWLTYDSNCLQWKHGPRPACRVQDQGRHCGHQRALHAVEHFAFRWLQAERHWEGARQRRSHGIPAGQVYQHQLGWIGLMMPLAVTMTILITSLLCQYLAASSYIV